MEVATTTDRQLIRALRRFYETERPFRHVDLGSEAQARAAAQRRRTRAEKKELYRELNRSLSTSAYPWGR